MVNVVAVELITTTPAHRVDGEQVVQLQSEELQVSINEVVTGSVEVSTVTHLRDIDVDTNLFSQHADVERVTIGRVVESAPDIREEDGIIIIPVVEEIVVVERRLVLKEEVHIRRGTSTRRHQETVTLRQQEAVVQRKPPP